MSAVAAADPTGEQVERYQAALSSAQQAFAAGKYESARRHLTRAYRIHKDPMLLFNIASSYRRQNNSKRAIFWYKRFLQAAPSHEQAPLARSTIEALESGTDAMTEPPAPKPEPIDKPKGKGGDVFLKDLLAPGEIDDPIEDADDLAMAKSPQPAEDNVEVADPSSDVSNGSSELVDPDTGDGPKDGMSAGPMSSWGALRWAGTGLIAAGAVGFIVTGVDLARGDSSTDPSSSEPVPLHHRPDHVMGEDEADQSSGGTVSTSGSGSGSNRPLLIGVASGVAVAAGVALHVWAWKRSASTSVSVAITPDGSASVGFAGRF